MYYRRAKTPKRANGSRYILFPLIAILIVLSFMYLAPVHDAIVLESDGGSLMFAVKEQNILTLSYTHSVNKTRVTDTIERVGNKFIVRCTLFENYGAGMPAKDDYPGAVFEETENGMLVTGLDAEYHIIELVAGNESDPVLNIKGNDYRLLDYVRAGGRLSIRVERVSLLKLLQLDPNLNA